MSDSWADRLWNWTITSGVRVIAIILAAVILYFIFRTVSRRLLKTARKIGEKSERISREQEMRAQTLAGIIRGLIILVTVVLVALMVLEELGYNVAPLIAGAGIAGVALGFGAQTMVKDMIGGFFVLLEGQFYVGDVIRVGEIEGRVEAIRLRTTLIRDDEGVLNIVPNGEMRVVSNMTKGFSRVVLDFGIDYHQDMDRAMRTIEGALEHAKALPEAGFVNGTPKLLGVERMEGSTVTLRVVAQTQPFRDAEVARAFRRLIIEELREQQVAMG